MAKHLYYPSDLAVFVRKRMRELNARVPALSTLQEILEVAFFASMKTEEAEQVLCNLSYIDMRTPDPRPPARIVADRWSFVRFGQPILFNVKNLVKVSKSVDCTVGALVICKNSDEKLVIWGAIDQQGQRTAYATNESEEGAETPGLMQIGITGVGAVEVHKGYQLIGALRQGKLAIGFSDVLEQQGPIQKIFQASIRNVVSRVKAKVGNGVFQARDHWDQSISDYWRRSLSRILLGVKRYGHGGAILLTPDNSNSGLSTKYSFEYRRLADALIRLSVHTIMLCDAEDEIHDNFLEHNAETIPALLHLDQSVSSSERGDTADEVTGCVRFIASLSRVDGLIVMNRELAVRGYGGIVNVKAEPPGVWVAGDPSGSVKKLRKIDPSHFGTRHQSMMRICFHRPGSVGFVVSQDGDVRAMTQVGSKLILWEDVKLLMA